MMILWKLGFDVAGARVGRVIDLELDVADADAARAEIERMCGELLANPLIESFEIIRLGDEAMTPDSSRFWPASDYAPGGPQPSFDKQFVRDWCESTGWNKEAPGPELPNEIVEGTRARYIEAFERLTEIPFSEYVARPEVVL